MKRTWAAALLLVAGLLGCRPIGEYDVFFQLFLGRAVLRSGSRVVPEPAAFHDFTDPCVVVEWLWNLSTYGVHQIFGFTGLSVLGALFSVACAASLLRLAKAYSPDSKLAILFVATLALLVAQLRMVLRPQVALLAGLPLYLALGHAYANAELSRRVKLGGVLALSTVLWAQVHGSVVLAPPIFAIQVIPLSFPLDRLKLRVDGMVFVLLLGSLLTSAYGVDIARFIYVNGFGDAPYYVVEMSPMTWALFDVTSSPYVSGFLLLWMLGLFGCVAARRLYVRELLLGLLGIALMLRANRFLSEAAILVMPFAGRGLRDLLEHLEGARSAISERRLLAVMLSPLLALGVWTARTVHAQYGPPATGLAPYRFPNMDSAYLRSLPAGSNVMTDYVSSAPLAFWSDGRVRVYVDGRAAVYFDEADFAVARELMRDGDALQRGLARFAAVAAVVRRDSAACTRLREIWPAVVVGPLYTTFVRDPAASAMQSLQPCGTRFLAADACAAPERIQRDMRTLERLGGAEVASYVRAAAEITCGGDVRGGLAVLDRLEPKSHEFSASFRRLRIHGLLATGQYDQAVAQMLSAIAANDQGVTNVLQDPVAGKLPLGAVQLVLEAHVRALRDEADPAVRAALANLCAARNDEDCARLQALRAAARGIPTPALEWLEQHHSVARVRRDARRWRETLAALQGRLATDPGSHRP